MNNSTDNKQTTILIVGGAKGIGRITCEQLMSESYRVIVADNSKADISKLNEQHGHINTFFMDITDSESVSKVIAQINKVSGKLDGVVICAAAHSTYPIEYVTDTHLEKIVNINLTSHIKLIRDLLPSIKDGGKIIGLSSNSADIGIPMESIYAATKAGVERIYEGLSVELSYRNIKPVIIHPGNVNTGFNETGNEYSPQGNAFVDEAYKKIVASMDSKYGIDPEVVARIIVKAIKTKNPKVRYIVGMNAYKSHWARRLLGVDLALKVMKKYFGV